MALEIKEVETSYFALFNVLDNKILISQTF